VVSATGIAWMALLGGCSTPAALNSSLNEPELRQRIDANFTPGMTVAQVQARLDDLRVPPRHRRLYPGPPQQLLARLMPRNGFWVDEPAFQDLYYTDAWFVFGPGDRLQRVDTERHRMRIQARQYVDPPFHTPELLPSEEEVRRERKDHAENAEAREGAP
jgi:hypothetical protein